MSKVIFCRVSTSLWSLLGIKGGNLSGYFLVNKLYFASQYALYQKNEKKNPNIKVTLKSWINNIKMAKGMTMGSVAINAFFLNKGTNLGLISLKSTFFIHFYPYHLSHFLSLVDLSLFNQVTNNAEL
jgi:hypothetical protein